MDHESPYMCKLCWGLPPTTQTLLIVLKSEVLNIQRIPIEELDLIKQSCKVSCESFNSMPSKNSFDVHFLWSISPARKTTSLQPISHTLTITFNIISLSQTSSNPLFHLLHSISTHVSAEDPLRSPTQYFHGTQADSSPILLKYPPLISLIFIAK
jgi:hypothetical protein